MSENGTCHARPEALAQMDRRRALALAVMALDEMAKRFQADRDWALAAWVVRQVQKEERERSNGRRS